MGIKTLSGKRSWHLKDQKLLKKIVDMTLFLYDWELLGPAPGLVAGK